ncbi:hypothetical protein FQR65_LT06186 [Abscondita terminalis]|nr:hypothetical protein FQR65_LT06186 [Abscondita terminalis]
MDIEKDSLFSDDDREEKVVVVATPESEEEDLQANYSEEDLDYLVYIIKSMTTLYDLRDEDWTPTAENNIKEFLVYLTIPIIIVYFEGDKLIVNTEFPKVPVLDLTFFMREPKQRFDIHNIHDLIMFGTVQESVEGTILNVLETVFSPVFFRITSWPDSILFYSKFLT